MDKGHRWLICHLRKRARLLNLGACGWRAEMIDLTSAEEGPALEVWSSWMKGVDD